MNKVFALSSFLKLRPGPVNARQLTQIRHQQSIINTFQSHPQYISHLSCGTLSIIIFFFIFIISSLLSRFLPHIFQPCPTLHHHLTNPHRCQTHQPTIARTLFMTEPSTSAPSKSRRSESQQLPDLASSPRIQDGLCT